MYHTEYALSLVQARVHASVCELLREHVREHVQSTLVRGLVRGVEKQNGYINNSTRAVMCPNILSAEYHCQKSESTASYLSMCIRSPL